MNVENKKEEKCEKVGSIEMCIRIQWSWVFSVNSSEYLRNQNLGLRVKKEINEREGVIAMRRKN